MNDQLLCLRGQLLKALMTALHGELITERSRYFGSLYVSGKLPTYPSPKPTLKLTSHLGQIIDLELNDLILFGLNYSHPLEISVLASYQPCKNVWC